MYGSGQHTVFVDANVLYSRTLRDWFCMIGTSAAGEVYQARWSEDVLTEALYHLRRQHPEWPSGKIEVVRTHLVTHLGHCKVTDFPVADSFLGSDPDDHHVHSAAVHCQADMVLTADPRGLLADGRDPDELPYEIWEPDEFFCYVDDCAPDVVRHEVKAQVAYWAGRCQGDVDLPGSLRRADAPEFAERVRRHLQVIARMR